MPTFGEGDLVALVVATGALGTAAFGIVEGLKRFRAIGEAGFPAIESFLGPIWGTLNQAYGQQFTELLRAQYVGDEKALIQSLRQGVRIGLTDKNAERIAEYLGLVAPDALKDAAAKKEKGGNLTDKQLNVLARYELAADARIDAALSVARDRYKNAMRLWATAVSLAVALVVAIVISETDDPPEGLFLTAVLVGVAAVPLAPIAKDVATAIQSSAKALRSKQS